MKFGYVPAKKTAIVIVGALLKIDKLKVVAERVSAIYLQEHEDRKSLSLPDPAPTLLFIQIISELVGLIERCKNPITSLKNPTAFKKVIIKHSIKNYLGKDNYHLTEGVSGAILEAGSELSEIDFLGLVEFIKEKKCEN